MTSSARRAFLKVTFPVKETYQPSFSTTLASSAERAQQWNTPRVPGWARTRSRVSLWASRSWTMAGRSSSPASASWAAKKSRELARSSGVLSQ